MRAGRARPRAGLMRRLAAGVAVALGSLAVLLGTREPSPQQAHGADPPPHQRICDVLAKRCDDALLERGAAPLVGSTPASCSVPTPAVRHHGSRGRPLVGLSFDDGPDDRTGAFVRVLRRFGVTATFFQIGEQVDDSSRDVERLILRSGSEIGVHAFHHESRPRHASLAATAGAIARVSGFRPCLFRPPEGLLDRRVRRAAAAAGQTIVIWDVDPGDWERPGTRRIVRRVLRRVRAGSIVVLHDGGGDRAQTLAALPKILRGLRRRGLRGATVTAVLGGRTWFR